MKRRSIAVSIFVGLVFWTAREVNRLEEGIDYVNDHSLNSNHLTMTGLKDSVKSNPEPKKARKKRHHAKLKELSPKKIYANAGYVVGIRIFKSVIIPITQQVIPVDTGGFGSGTIMKCKKYKYCVLTAFHVVDNSSMTYFAQPKDGSPAQVLELIAGTTTNDSAVLRFVDTSYIPKSVAVLGNSDKLPAGARVCAIGSNGFADFWISVGNTYSKVVSPSGEFKDDLKSHGTYHHRVIPVDAKIYHGYSGGPLLDEYGRIVGINVSVTMLDWHVIQISIPINEINKEFKILK